jgi:hypothetical protein
VDELGRVLGRGGGDDLRRIPFSVVLPAASNVIDGIIPLYCVSLNSNVQVKHNSFCSFLDCDTLKMEAADSSRLP